MSQFPTIESFFQPLSTPEVKVKTTSGKVGDGFTEDEVHSALNPTSDTWKPQEVYEEVDIGELLPGPGRFNVTGRVVNLYEAATPSKMPTSAKGFYKMIIKDGTGVLLVKLWYASFEYKIVLGCLISLWTTHVSAVSRNPGSPFAPDPDLYTSVFPERDCKSYVIILDAADAKDKCRIPPGYIGGHIPDLVTLKQFVEGGNEIPNAKVLVCVKSISAPKTVITKKGTSATLVNVTVVDQSRASGFSLWAKMITSAATWRPCSTVLLLSHISCNERGWLALKGDSQIDVDPDIGDAHYLRRKIQRESQRQHVNLPFPADLFDVEAFESAQRRILFTLADMETFVQASPNGQSHLEENADADKSPEILMGYFSIMITEVNILSLHHKKRLLCGECCNTPHYSNKPVATCTVCAQPLTLRVNPHLLGDLIDETGCISSSSFIWSDDAWTELLGQTVKELLEADIELLRYLEARMAYLRVTLLVGWGGDDVRCGGRLCVCRVLA